MSELRQHALELLQGSYEMHAHTAPSHLPRMFDDWQYAAELDRYGMAGSVIKKHFGSTADRAELVNRHGGFKAKLYGSLVLDCPSGGLNPYAVEAELLAGAKLIYLPTFHARNSQLKMPVKITAYDEITVFGEDGKLLPVLYDIMALVKQYDAVLCTGHVSAEEAYAVTVAGIEEGCTMMLTHPDMRIIDMPAEQQKELAAKGAFVEKAWCNVTEGTCSQDEYAARIRLIGCRRCVMVTDYGQPHNPSPQEGELSFIMSLLERGLSDEEIRQMNTVNAKELLRIC